MDTKNHIWWNVLVEFSDPDNEVTADEAMDRFFAAMQRYEGAVSGDKHSYCVRMSIESYDAGVAAMVGWAYASQAAEHVGLPEFPCTRLEVVTQKQIEDELKVAAAA